MTDKVKISRGNTKLGKMPNVSLVPVKDCGNCSHCAADCYALKAFRQYPATRAAWQHNSAIFRAGGYTAIADDIVSQLEKRPSRFFRIHVAGDFLSQEHVDLWKVIARRLPSTTFLA